MTPRRAGAASLLAFSSSRPRLRGHAVRARCRAARGASPVRSGSPPLDFPVHCATLSKKVREGPALVPRLVREKPVPVCAVALALRRSASSSVKAANSPAIHRGSLARLLSPLRGCRAPRAFLEGIDRVHEVASVFLGEPLPPWETLPTIACPPSFTVTCSTRTVCSPSLRYRLSASICAAKVRASLLKARSGRLPGERAEMMMSRA
jgi:hypothetical protein